MYFMYSISDFNGNALEITIDNGYLVIQSYSMIN